MTHPDQTEIDVLRASLRSAYATIGTKTEALRAAREGLTNILASVTLVAACKIVGDTLNAIDEALRGHATATAPSVTPDEHLAAEVRRAARAFQTAVSEAASAGLAVRLSLGEDLSAPWGYTRMAVYPTMSFEMSVSLERLTKL